MDSGLTTPFPSIGSIRGFTNHKNACYSNSTVQCLYHCYDLKNKLISSMNDIRIHAMEYGTKTSVDTSIFRRLAGNPFTGDEQQDAVEFLECLASRLPALYNSICFQQQIDTICSNCQHKVRCVQEDIIVKVQIPDESHYRLTNLETLFAKINEFERIPDRRCEICKISGAVRCTKIISASDYLILQLMIFRQNEKIKDLKLISLPKSRLAVAGHVYEPFSAVFHHGDVMDEGHYSSFHRDGQQWLQADDLQVSVARWPSDSENLYMLLCRKIS